MNQLVRRVRCGIMLGMLLIAAGCETTCRSVQGVATGVATTVEGAAVGASHDVKNSANFLMRVDNWIKENLW